METYTKNEFIYSVENLPYVKVLLSERLGDFSSEVMEGVWVLTLKGNEDNGMGLLVNANMTVNIARPRKWDYVQYRTLDPDKKPIIVAVLETTSQDEDLDSIKAWCSDNQPKMEPPIEE